MTDPRLAHDIESEINDHIERRVRDLCRTGMTEPDARAQATAEFGDLSAAKRDLLRIGGRIERRRRPRIWSGLGGDVRTSARRLAGQPGATALTVLTLALAIGVAAAVFSIVDQLILRTAPFSHGDRLVDVYHQPGPGLPGGGPIRPPKLLAWQQQPAVFERLETYAAVSFDLTESTEPARILARVVSLGLLDMLGIRMHIGRPFAEGDGAPGSEKVAILSHEFWTARFGASPAALGSRLVLNDEPYTIIGVLRPKTMLINDDEPVWLPLDVGAWGTNAPRYGYYAIGRLNPALNAVEAQATADSLAEQLGKASPLEGSWYLRIRQKLAADITTPARQTLFVLLGAVGLLLLIACVNVTITTLAETLRREREARVRAAIGASRWRLFRESIVGTLLVAAIAGLAAAAIARTALSMLVAVAPDDLILRTTRVVEVDARVLAVMTVVTLSAGLLAGLLPGLRSSRVDLSHALRDGMRGSRRGTSFGAGIGALVVAELALAMVLLVGVALMSRTLMSYYRLEPGFDVERLVTVPIDLPSHRYRTEQARRGFFMSLDERLRSHPGMEGLAYGWGVPPQTGYGSGTPQAEGGEPHPEMEYPANVVSSTYFATTGTPILAGRAFTPADRDDVVVISEAFAQLLWPGSPAVGKRFRGSPEEPWLTVVGVAGNVEARAFDVRTALHTYTPILPLPSDWTPAVAPPRSHIHQVLIVRSQNPASAAAIIREQIRALDPDQPVGAFTPATRSYAAPLAQQQFLLSVMGVFAAIALLLAAMGIFGVLSQAVTQRRREIGIRVALGAGRARLIRMLVGHGMLLAAIGVVAGTAAALAGVRTIESLLFGVSPFDVVSFASVVLLLLLVALVACWWPTRRALGVEPAEVLRSE
ncbi:MAG: ADOP family duplicated permease [Acidobacteriota bacterium]|nr:ADOP family duplicated permease [Acidobacteriota bacterium]